MFVPGLLHITTTLWSLNTKNVTDDVHRLITKYREFAQAEDIIGSLEKLGEHSRELYALGEGVGPLLSEGINVTWESDSDEAKALQELHKLFPNVVDDDDWSWYSPKEAVFNSMAYVTAPYLNTSDIERLFQTLKNEIYNIFIDPNALFDPYFRGGFYNVYASRLVLQGIKWRDLVNCRPTTGLEYARFMRVREAFERLESRLNISLHDEFKTPSDIMPNDLLASSLRASPESVVAMIEIIDSAKSVASPANYLDSAQETLNFFNSSGMRGMTIKDAKRQVLYGVLSRALKHLSKDEEAARTGEWATMCNVQREQPEKVTTFYFNQTVLFSEMSRIQSDLLRLVLVKSLIGPIPRSVYHNYRGFAPIFFFYDEVEKSMQALQRTGQYLAKFTRDIQELSLPYIPILAVKHVIGAAPLHPSDDLNDIARKVQKVLLEMQVPKSFDYDFQVVVLPQSEEGVEWTVKGGRKDWAFANSYTRINFNGLDVHIFRFIRENAEEFVSSAKYWIDENREELQRQLMSYDSETSAVEVLADMNRSKRGPLLGLAWRGGNYVVGYKSMLLTRTRKWLIPNSDQFKPTEVGIAAYDDLSRRIEAVFPLVNSSSPIHSWNAFFFV